MKQEQFNFKKKYGQNFLKDDSIPRKIVEAANIPDDTLVIEIGPGAGALTKFLATRAKQVLAYEIDDSLEEILDTNLIGLDNVCVIYDDFLKRDILKDLSNYSYSHLYVVANLPYYITTPIITGLVESGLDIEKIVVMIQKEVADRYAARVGTREYGSITVFLNYYYDIKKEFLVSRNCFVPKPNVDSIIISLNRKKDLLPLNNEKLFLTFTFSFSDNNTILLLIILIYLFRLNSTIIFFVINMVRIKGINKINKFIKNLLICLYGK